MTSSRVGDTSEVAEQTLRQQFLENEHCGKPPPTVIWQNGKAQLSSLLTPALAIA